jgi:hypothetical protein
MEKIKTYLAQGQHFISYFQLVRKIRALIIEPTSSAASCFNVPTSSSQGL